MATAVTVRMNEPDERLYRIGEVSRLTGVKSFVLRYWEQEIPVLQPVKTPTGHRLYRREDIDTVIEIKRLLYEEGFTLAGARKHLGGPNAEVAMRVENSNDSSAQREVTISLGSASGGPRPMRLSVARQKLLLELQQELRAILTLLESE